MLRANRPILAFFDAIKSLRVRQLALILKAGYDPNLMINSRGQNGLQFMAQFFNATDAHFRLQAPINKSAYLSMAKLLLDSGLDPNATDLLSDETVLFDAIRFNDRELVALLLNYVDLSLRNKSGETALMCAARFGSKQVVRLMLEHLRHLELDGYFLRQRNRLGLTPLELARAENLEAAKVLARHLIAYGHQHHHQAGALLARSASHHQLATAAGAYHPHLLMGPRVGGAGARGPMGVAAGRAPAGPGADLLADYGDLSAASTDYESDLLLAGGVGVGGMGARRPRLARPAQLAPGSYYDPKAAEFSAYLLEQQDNLMASIERDAPPAHSSGAAGGQMRAGLSEDEDAGAAADAFGYGARRQSGAGQLVRSRSCLLGPSSSGAQAGDRASGQQQQQRQAGKKSAAADWQS